MKIEAFERGARKYCQVMELDPDEILKPRNRPRWQGIAEMLRHKAAVRLALQQLITP